MENIAKSDPSSSVPGGIAAFSYPPDHPAMQLWLQPEHGLLRRIHAAMQFAQAHPARTVVVLPYAQLIAMATRLWATSFPDGFMPRFETTTNWSRALRAPVMLPTDISMDVALDVLTAQALLASAGLGSEPHALAPLLVQAAHQLAPLAAACPPEERSVWAQSARHAAQLGMESSALRFEAALGRVAVEWAAASGYVTDVLFNRPACGDVDVVIWVQGLAQEPLATGLQKVWKAQLVCLPLSEAPPSAGFGAGAGADVGANARAQMHACLDAEEEAQRTTACALQHVEAGRYPIALVSSDRALTRRVRSMLDALGVQVRDENGWKLSTSRAAAQVMTLLKAGAWNASTDAVVAALKLAPAFESVVDSLEAALRRAQLWTWSSAAHSEPLAALAGLVPVRTWVDAWCRQCTGRRSLLQWIAVLRSGLQQGGQWDALLADGPGLKVAQVLRLQPLQAQAWESVAADALWARQRWDLTEFTQWVNVTLEAASYQPPYPEKEEVVILPMSQMLGRPFAALVLAGCDEVRLNPSVEPPGGWTRVQREALGLPSRAVLEGNVRAAWHFALQTPVIDILWRTGDDTGEALMPSVLVQLMQLDATTRTGLGDTRTLKPVVVAPVPRPKPKGELLPLHHLSASAYEDLRQCPYRFFALRQWGLKAVEELDGEVGKRDFGLWLHDVLKQFHEALLAHPVPQTEVRRGMLDAASAATTAAMALEPGEFLPFAAAWPQVRDQYLQWLEGHEASTASFVSAETSHRLELGVITLVGRIDRLDRTAQDETLVIDYKTEPLAKTRLRVKEPLEDTQMAFYAALLSDDTLRGMYVNVSERDGTKPCEQRELMDARDALIEGIVQDMDAIAAGAALPALGEGVACDYCDARGLCRKDFWAAT